MLFVAPDIIEPTEIKVSLFPIADFSTRPQRMLKRVMLASDMKPPPFIVNVDGNEVDPETILERTDSAVVAVHYKPKKKRGDQIERYEEVQLPHSNKASAVWKQEVYLLGNYCQYRQKFVSLLKLFSNM